MHTSRKGYVYNMTIMLAVFILLYAGAFLHNSIATVIFIVFSWVLAIIHIYGYLSRNVTRAVILSYLSGDDLPFILDVFQYAVFIIVPLYMGWMVTASAWIIVTYVDMNARYLAMQVEKDFIQQDNGKIDGRIE